MNQRKTRKIEFPDAAMPVQTELPVAVALQALQRGEATPEQQKRALDAIINNFCLTYDLPYRRDHHETDFMCGRMFVGQQIVKHLKINTALLEKKK